MQNLKNKSMAILIALLLTISMSASIILIPNTSAHTPAWNITSHPYVVALPNPVGVGQTAIIYMWNGIAPVFSSAITNNYRFHNFALTIIAPDGTVSTQNWPVVQDTTGAQSYSFTPNQVGTYNLTFTYAGETLTASNQPAGSVYVNDTYTPGSNSATLTVQQAAIPNSPVSVPPFPTEYWTRPIYGENTAWASISSNWLGTGSPVNSATGSGTLTGISFNGALIQRYPGDAVGPTTSHVMWTYPIEEGGVVGGNLSYIQGNTYFDGSAYQQRFVNPIILAGNLYYTLPVSFTGPSSGATVCQDLRTGQIIWSSTQIPPLSFGYIYDQQDPNQHGTYPAILFTANFARAFDAYTGDPLFNVTGVPTGAATQGPQGEQLRYVLANGGNTTKPSWYLSEWNSSSLWERLANPWTGAAANSPTIYNDSYVNGTTLSANDAAQAAVSEPTIGTPAGTNNNAPATSNYVIYANVVNSTSFLYSYDWNVSIPWRNTMPQTPTVLAAFYGNMMLCMNGTYPAYSYQANYLSTPYTYFAVNLNPNRGAIGSILWTQTYTVPPGNISVSFGGADPTVGVFVENYKETMQFVGYSLTTGQQLWGPNTAQLPLAFYGQEGFVASQVAYGKLYSSSYGGLVYCYDLTNGNLLWTFGNGGAGNSTQSYFQVPGNFPTYINAVGNGIIYTVTSEHTIETPIYQGAEARALNATTGQEIWALSADNNEFSTMSYAIADGYATTFNAYDDQVYSIGQGPSAITVTAPDFGISLGTSVVIQGTVMDVSAGTQQTEQKADFPSGVPVASDASMTDWMGYVYQQQPMPTDFTGVTVQLSVIDQNNNTRPIGTAVTDINGAYSYQWTPDITGKYTVYASFAGSNSYWPSHASTAFAVDPAATPVPTAAPLTDLATNANLMTFMAIGVIAIIIAIAVVGLLLLRKHA
jgi:outer membrane protein assembly factor BamB